jgi:hypothetical protein
MRAVQMVKVYFFHKGFFKPQLETLTFLSLMSHDLQESEDVNIFNWKQFHPEKKIRIMLIEGKDYWFRQLAVSVFLLQGALTPFIETLDTKQEMILRFICVSKGKILSVLSPTYELYFSKYSQLYFFS